MVKGSMISRNKYLISFYSSLNLIIKFNNPQLIMIMIMIMIMIVIIIFIYIALFQVAQ